MRLRFLGTIGSYILGPRRLLHKKLECVAKDADWVAKEDPLDPSKESGTSPAFDPIFLNPAFRISLGYTTRQSLVHIVASSKTCSTQ